jgi:hypothetical protein
MSLWSIWRKPYTYLAPTLTPSPNKPKWDSRGPTSLRSSMRCVQNNFRAYGTFGINRAPILRQDWHYLQTDRNVLPLEPHHLGVPSGVSKSISEPMARLAQIVHHLAPSFHMIHITLQFHRVRPKLLLSLCYVWWKPCNYLVWRLALSVNKPKWGSSWASSPRSTIGFIQNDFLA